MREFRAILSVHEDDLYVQFTEHHPGRPVIIFLHDSLGCVELWRDFPQRLAAATGCNLLVYDRLGYGRSAPFKNLERKNTYLEEEADVLYRLIDLLQLKNVLLFGHSDGGSIALIAAAKYPAIITAVIAEAAHIFVEELTLEGIRSAVNAYEKSGLEKRLEKYHGDKTRDVFRAWTETWLDDNFRSWNIENYLPSINCPVLIIQGENDEYGTLNQVHGIADHIQGHSEIFLLPGTGHTPHKEAADAVLERCTVFIRNITAGRDH